jgi:hypothetical protein
VTYPERFSKQHSFFHIIPRVLGTFTPNTFNYSCCDSHCAIWHHRIWVRVVPRRFAPTAGLTVAIYGIVGKFYGDIKEVEDEDSQRVLGGNQVRREWERMWRDRVEPSTRKQSYRCVRHIMRNDKRRSDSLGLVSWDRESTVKVVNELFYYFLKLTSYSVRFLPPPKSWRGLKHNVEICMVMFQSPPDSATISSHELSKSLRSTYSADFRERFSNCEPRLARDSRSSQSW